MIACSSTPATRPPPGNLRAGESVAATAKGGRDGEAWEAVLRQRCHDEEFGCFAWSDRLAGAACNDEAGIRFIGSQLPRVEPRPGCGSAPAAARLLAENDFVQLRTEQRRPLAPGLSEIAGVTLTWKGLVVAAGDENSPTIYDHTIIATCARSPRSETVVVLHKQMEAGDGAVWHVGSHL
ncbi:MAG: hypothetical protein H6Q90_3022, partial [Deltaproteobacteria bacterium]|nr:hypothetical protein [Deltaproteobacteria bacterium]